MEEQRAHQRSRVNMKVSYRDNGFAFKMGRVSNISKGGMFISTSSKPETPDGYLIASLDAEEFGKVIWTQGRIIRKTDSGMAVAFTRIDDKGLDVLLKFQGVSY